MWQCLVVPELGHTSGPTSSFHWGIFPVSTHCSFFSSFYKCLLTFILPSASQIGKVRDTKSRTELRVSRQTQQQQIFEELVSGRDSSVGETGCREQARGIYFTLSSLGRRCHLLCAGVPHWLIEPLSVPQTAEVRRRAGLLALKLPSWTESVISRQL